MNTNTTKKLSAALGLVLSLAALSANAADTARVERIVDLPAVTVQPDAALRAELGLVRTVDLPAVTVRPEAADLAYFHSNNIVDLATITVRPEASDLAQFLASNTARIVDMPVVTVRPSVEDMQIVAIGAATLAQQLASR